MLRLRKYINEEHEAMALVDEDTKEVLLCGDEYHYDIVARIEGFLMALKYCGKEYKLLPTSWVNSDEFFEKIGFDTDDEKYSIVTIYTGNRPYYGHLSNEDVDKYNSGESEGAFKLLLPYQKEEYVIVNVKDITSIHVGKYKDIRDYQ